MLFIFGFCWPKIGEISEIWPKIGQKMPKNEKIKNLIVGTLKLTILQPWSKFWVPNIIWGQVISILVIFQKSHLKFGLTIENGHFRVGRRAIFRQRSKLFKFRKKRLLSLTELYHILENWKLPQKSGLPPPPITLTYCITSIWFYYWSQSPTNIQTFIHNKT